MFFLVYIGAAIISLWGVAHLVPTAAVLRGFGELSANNRRILLMEWVAEGLTLSFLGILVLLVAAVGDNGTIEKTVFAAVSIMLLVMALWSGFTGARTSILPMKFCPLVKSIAAVLILAGSFFP